LGRLSVAVSGCSAPVSAVLGKLYMVGKIRLYKPKLYQALGYANKFDVWNNLSFNWNGTYITDFGGTSANAQPYPGMGGTLSTNTYTFPPNLQQGRFLFMISSAMSSAGVTTYTANFTLVNCVYKAIIPSAGALTNWSLGFFITVTGPNASVGWTSVISTGATQTANSGYFAVFQVYPVGANDA
jgi:hypothetical protein